MMDKHSLDQTSDLSRRLRAVQDQFESGLARYLATKGPDRQDLTMQLLRLKWAEEELLETTAQTAQQRAAVVIAAGLIA